VSEPPADLVPCRWGDETCPCQDGDPCHYEGDMPMMPPAVWRWVDVVGLDAAAEALREAINYRDHGAVP